MREGHWRPLVALPADAAALRRRRRRGGGRQHGPRLEREIVRPACRGGEHREVHVAEHCAGAHCDPLHVNHACADTARVNTKRGRRCKCARAWGQCGAADTNAAQHTHAHARSTCTHAPPGAAAAVRTAGARRTCRAARRSAGTRPGPLRTGRSRAGATRARAQPRARAPSCSSWTALPATPAGTARGYKHTHNTETNTTQTNTHTNTHTSAHRYKQTPKHAQNRAHRRTTPTSTRVPLTHLRRVHRAYDVHGRTPVGRQPLRAARHPAQRAGGLPRAAHRLRVGDTHGPTGAPPARPAARRRVCRARRDTIARLSCGRTRRRKRDVPRTPDERGARRACERPLASCTAEPQSSNWQRTGSGPSAGAHAPRHTAHVACAAAATTSASRSSPSGTHRSRYLRAKPACANACVEGMHAQANHVRINQRKTARKRQGD